MTGPVIGRGPKPTPTPAPTQTILGLGDGGLGSAIANAGASVGLPKVYNTLPAIGTIDFVTKLTKAQMQQIIPYLDKFGATKTDISTVGNAKKYLQNNYNTYVENSGGSLTKLIQLFKNDYIPSDTAQIKEPTLPTRAISELDKKTTFEQIDNWAQKTLMTTVTDKQKADLFNILKGMNVGTVTSYKKALNEDTGKMENVQTTTPGLTSDKAAMTIEEKLKELNPDDFDRAQRIGFSEWLSKNVTGA